MSEKPGTIGKAVTTGGLLLTACAVCCAPPVATAMIALFAAGGVGVASVGKIGLGIAVLGVIGGYLYLRRRAALRRAASCSLRRGAGCSCGQVGGCAEAGVGSQRQRDQKR
ncbi:hypothetical protein [Microbulbifer rhizosphaerae]|uniref:Mercuric ion transport protein n=1 Tax=Microbulbifer rhizosphaerae TaxID=1562603 RepID=A0A7W4WBP3_9GAMM|nr:hypothetical protein [Microbulbifer rhizosphaerae]MBB3061322.1 hypothetical protein [Microbulbifer rhizosphaerae]